MISLLKLHKKNRETKKRLEAYFLDDKIKPCNYKILSDSLDNSLLDVECELYESIKNSEDITLYYKKICGLIAVLYVIGLATIIEVWISE